MIPQQYITEWSEIAPWKANKQVEQDLVICRVLVVLFSDEFIAEKVAFRGGTAIHKLFLEPQPRFSEDIDLVQISAEPIGSSIDKIRKLLSFLGEPRIKQKDRKTSPTVVMNKYRNVADLLDKSDLSVRRIAGITGHSINTVRKIKELKEI